MIMTKGVSEQGGVVDQNFTLKQIVKKAWKKKFKVYMGCMELEKPNDRANREALWQGLRMYDVDGKLLNDIKDMYVNSLPCVRVKGGGSECFRIDSGMRKRCIMSSWLFNLYMDAVMKEVKMGMGEEKLDFRRLPGLLYPDDLVLCGESKEYLRAMVRCFVGVFRRRGLDVNTGKSKVMVLDGEETLDFEVFADRIRLEHVFWTNQVQMR